MARSFDVLSVGDVTIDTFLFINDAHVNCTLKKDECQLCVNYADKLPVEKLMRTTAGNASNNAVGSARLGARVALVSWVGDDAMGAVIRADLKKEGVDTRHVVIDKKTQTNSSIVLSFQGERTIFVYHAPRVYALPSDAPRAAWIYYTSVGEKHARLNKDVLAYVKKTGAQLAFNPGTYQLRTGLTALKPLIAACAILFVNKEEAGRILGKLSDIKIMLQELHAFGARIVVITDGPNGSFVFDGNKFSSYGIPSSPVVERTGAGDAYATAFTIARMRGASIDDAMKQGTMNSTGVIMKVGPHAGLLDQKTMKKFLKKYSSVK